MSSHVSSGENLLKAVHFDKPAYIPMTFVINSACWQYYPQDALQELMADHPFLFPGFTTTREKIVPDFEPYQRMGESFEDPWGCTWETSENGITGVVTKHPLKNWEAFESYTPPSPECTDGIVPINWEEIARNLQQSQSEGELRHGALKHGHTFLLLCDIRGYENTLFDMFDEEPRLLRLMEMVENFNTGLITRFLNLGVDYMSYGEDLGMQVGPMLSPNLFRRYIKPIYQRMMKPARDAGCIVHMHSDGDIRLLADDLVDGGVQVLNLQDLVNGVDWIAEKFAGRICIELDIDRQSTTFRGSPDEIDALIRYEVEKIGSKEGGLMMIYGLYPGIPLENVKAIMDAMERYSTYYA